MPQYEFDALVFIGRFQPLHNGHCVIIDEALRRAKQVIVLVGSADEPRTIRNPFTFSERYQMLTLAFKETMEWDTDIGAHRLIIQPIQDFPYNEDKWLSQVQTTVYRSMKFSPDPLKIGLIGHSKDHTSYYLKMFPGWASVGVPNVDGIDATDIRVAYYTTKSVITNNPWIDMVPRTTNRFLLDFRRERYEEFKLLQAEYAMIEAYKASWANAPYAPTFITTDAVVTQSGHVLLVRRGAAPGKGLWALPGGFLDNKERIEDGVIRELREETKIKVPDPVLRGSIKATKVFDAPNRSARGRTITHAYHIDLGFDTKLPKVKGSDDADKARWVPFSDVRRDELFEDHFHILDYFCNAVR